jgi:tetratricopeptide (TPR) repeat protein
MADRPARGEGGEADLHDAGLQLGRALHDSNRFLVLRVPESWKNVERASAVESAVPSSRAAALLSGIFAGGSGVALVSDTAVTAERLGFFSKVRIQLPGYHVELKSLDAFNWGSYRHAFDALLRTDGLPSKASPLAWRLAVGTVALGRSIDDVREALQSSVPLPLLARLLSAGIREDPAITASVTRFLTVRRPIERVSLDELTGAAPQHLPLLTMCIGYGDDTIRVTPLVRSALRLLVESRSADLMQTHAALAAYYVKADGALSSATLNAPETRAWCEKVHHLGQAGEAGAVEWAKQELPSPEFYWDRARHLSIVKQNYRAAADVYQRCTQKFPGDDYAWHYYAWNLQRSVGAVSDIETGYRKAIDLAPENPWWNARLITFLASTGQASASRHEWTQALERVDPEGTQVRSTPWLARSFHRWVCREWARAGRMRWAREVLDLVPEQQRRQGAWRFLARVITEGDLPLRAYLEQVEKREELTPEHVDHVRDRWAWLRASVDDLPLPMAEPTADGERFQFVWSYRGCLVEIDIEPDGAISWFAKDRITGGAEGGEFSMEEQGAALLNWLKKIVDA